MGERGEEWKQMINENERLIKSTIKTIMKTIDWKKSTQGNQRKTMLLLLGFERGLTVIVANWIERRRGGGDVCR